MAHKDSADATAYNRRWRAANPDKVAAWRPVHRTRENQKYRQMRDDLIAAYGGGCQCCGEPLRAFLTIEHVNGLPPEHREATGKRKGSAKVVRLLWLYLQEHGITDSRCTIFCFNCNSGRAANGGICPHKEVMPL